MIECLIQLRRKVVIVFVRLLHQNSERPADASATTGIPWPALSKVAVDPRKKPLICMTIFRGSVEGSSLLLSDEKDFPVPLRQTSLI